LPRQIIKARVATGLPDFPFLRGSHAVDNEIERPRCKDSTCLALVGRKRLWLSF
jgi:hypothetical protein